MGDPGKADLEHQEQHLKLEKLAADVVLSKRQASKQWLALEWLKAATVPVALFGILATSVVSVFQLDVAQSQAHVAQRQAQLAREQFDTQVANASRQALVADHERRLERLDKAVERLSRDAVSDRIAGVTAI